MRIIRPTYLSRLIAHKHNRLIKIITGIRRCGKSFLLFDFSVSICMKKALMTIISLEYPWMTANIRNCEIPIKIC